jgi:hypothetical protein
MPEALVIICYCFQHHRRTTTFFSGPKGCLTPTGVVAVKHTKHSFNPAKFLVQLSYALHVNRIGDTQKFFTLKSANGVGIFITTFRSSPKCMLRYNIRSFQSQDYYLDFQRRSIFTSGISIAHVTLTIRTSSQKFCP